MARKSNRVRIYKPPKSRRGWKYSKGKKPKKRKQVVLESKMIQRHTTGQISNEISPSWTQTQSERDTRTILSTVDHGGQRCPDSIRIYCAVSFGQNQVQI